MEWFALALLAWLWGAGNHYWPGPFRVATSLYYRATNRWSDPDDTTDDDTDDMSRHDTQDVDDEGESLVRRIRRMDGPRPLQELLGDDELDDADGEADPWLPLPRESRTDWVARQSARRSARTTDIQRHGARHFGCAERTIQRDLRALAKDDDQGTMGGRR